MADQFMFYGAMALSIAPTLLLMYFLLRKYTFPQVERPYFSDPTFFLLFAVGLVQGTVMFLVESYLMGNIVYTVIFGVIQVLLPIAVMNIKRYRGKTDSVFYGLGFGLGAGASMSTGLIFYISSLLNTDVDLPLWIFLFVVGLSMILQYSAVGITVGDGIARHDPMRYGFQAVISNVVYWIVFGIMLMNSKSVILYVFAFAILQISSVYLWFGYTTEIQNIVQEADAQNGITQAAVGKRHRPKLK